MEDIELKDIGIEEFKKDIYLHYLEIFPKDERKPIELNYLIRSNTQEL